MCVRVCHDVFNCAQERETALQLELENELNQLNREWAARTQEKVASCIKAHNSRRKDAIQVETAKLKV